MTAPDTGADLTALATWIDEQLDDETADRQWIAESAAAKVRDITLQLLGAAALGDYEQGRADEAAAWGEVIDGGLANAEPGHRADVLNYEHFDCCGQGMVPLPDPGERRPRIDGSIPEPTGPFETEAQAEELPAVRAVYDAMHASARRGVMGEENHRVLLGACRSAGVSLGDYDRRILVWLAGWEPETCAVFAGIISRAGAR